MKIDLEADMTKLFADIVGYDANAKIRSKISKMDFTDLALLYYNWESRLVERRPRRDIYVSAELEAKMPSIELASDVYTLIDKIRSGDDLTPHLSERVKIIYTSTSNSSNCSSPILAAL